MKDQTIAIHGGYETEPTTKAVATPIYQTVAYEFDNAQHGADLFNLAVPGNIYTRIMNPTTDVLEKRVALLEGGVGALGLSAGSAAVHYAIINLAEAGDNIVTTPQLYGGTYTLFAHMLPKLGIEVRFAESDSAADLEKLIDKRTKAVYFESIGNPAGNIVDVAAVAQMARSHGVATIVDNTVATPVLLKPFQYGADIVVHSATKYMGGHGTTLGGLIVDSGQFPWAEHKERYPMFNEPEPSYRRRRVRRCARTGRVHRPCAHRAVAQHRLGTLAVQRLPAPARHRNAAAAHGAALPERPARRRILARAQARRLGELCGSEESPAS